MPPLPPAGGVSRERGASQEASLSGLRILGTARAWLRRSPRAFAAGWPGARGAWGNRTGRTFTGDRSGDFLYNALFEAGFASQPTSVSIDDGLKLNDAYISAAVRCAPPANKPAPEEIRNCRPYFERELELLTRVTVVVALGRLAFDVYLGVLRDQHKIASRSRFKFTHGGEHRTGPGQPLLISSYHPSQQNTFTGKLTPAMLLAVFRRARRNL